MLFGGMSTGLLWERDVPAQALDRVRVAIERSARTLPIESRVARWGMYQALLLRHVIDEWWAGERLPSVVLPRRTHDGRTPSPEGPSSPRDVYARCVLPRLPQARDAVAGAPARRVAALEPTHAQMVACAAYAELERLCGEVALGLSPEAARAALSDATGLAVAIGRTCGAAPDASLLDPWGDDDWDGPARDVAADAETLKCLRATYGTVTYCLRPALEDVPWPEGSSEGLVRDMRRAERALWPREWSVCCTILEWAKPVPLPGDPHGLTLAEVVAASRAPAARGAAHMARNAKISVTRGAARGLVAFCDVVLALMSRSRRDEGDMVWMGSCGFRVSRSSLADLRGRLLSVGGDPWETVP